MSKGGCFQFSSKSDGLYLTVFPSGTNNAESVQEVLYYIDKKKLPACDSVLINDAFKQASEKPYTFKISDENVFPVSEFGDYRISSDHMIMEAVFYPPFEGADLLKEDEICNDIMHMGVKHGIDHEAIKKFIAEREYGKCYIIARGTKPREGTDGYIEYKFQTDLKPVPKMNEDGSVDFHTLENVNHVKANEVVAILHPEDRGEDGMDLNERAVHPRRVNHVIFRHGKNLSVSEDGRSLISKVSGHVTLEDGKVFVSNVLELVDVDNSTGNIEYDGSVTIKGNVLAGFSVHAAGDISVSGIVEGAELTAGGNITLNRGVQGMNRATIKAGGNIVTKFIEGAQMVQASGSIDTDSILHSKVIARGPIKASGRNGLIVGGDVKSTVLIEAKTIGNEMGTATIVGVGVDPEAKRRVDQLKKELDSSGNNKIQLNQILTALRKKQELDGKLSPDKLDLQRKTMRNLIELEQRLSADKKELEELRQDLDEDENARIKINNSMYIGTKLVFGDQFLFIKQKCDYCQFVKEKSEIKCLTL